MMPVSYVKKREREIRKEKLFFSDLVIFNLARKKTSKINFKDLKQLFIDKCEKSKFSYNIFSN
jgi:hypothetical protein